MIVEVAVNEKEDSAFFFFFPSQLLRFFFFLFFLPCGENLGKIGNKRAGELEFREMEEHGGHGGDHMSFLASSLKATSLSLPGTISLSDPTWRKHKII